MQLIIQGAIILVVALLLYNLFTRRMIQRIRTSVDYLQNVADGVLTSKELQVKSNDGDGSVSSSCK